MHAAIFLLAILAPLLAAAECAPAEERPWHNHMHLRCDRNGTVTSEKRWRLHPLKAQQLFLRHYTPDAVDVTARLGDCARMGCAGQCFCRHAPSAPESTYTCYCADAGSSFAVMEVAGDEACVLRSTPPSRGD